MKITDGKRTVEIRMMVWTGTGYSPDWSNDFFDAGCLNCSEEGIHIVPDVGWCIEQAQDWCNQRGDYADDGIPDPEDRYVEVSDINNAV